jgi:hypothetical protein
MYSGISFPLIVKLLGLNEGFVNPFSMAVIVKLSELSKSKLKITSTSISSPALFKTFAKYEF